MSSTVNGRDFLEGSEVLTQVGSEIDFDQEGGDSFRGAMQSKMELDHVGKHEDPGPGKRPGSPCLTTRGVQLHLGTLLNRYSGGALTDRHRHVTPARKGQHERCCTGMKRGRESGTVDRDPRCLDIGSC
jgi:hypothetical protein